MVVTLTVNGGEFLYPETGDSGWGYAGTAWAAAVSSATLQKAGGNFYLTAEVDFGPNYGLKSSYFKSRTINPASSGAIRLANSDTVSWRNTANNADLPLSVNNQDSLLFNGEILATTTINNITGSDGITVVSGVDNIDIQGFYTEFTSASGSLSSEIDSDIATHAGIADAHHSRYTDADAIAATEPYRYTLSGTLSSEIDSDIATHTANTSAHHSRYQKSENDALIGSDGITVSSGSNTIGIEGFRTEFVSASGSLDYNKVDRSGDTMWGTLDIQDGAGLIVDGNATTSGSLSVGSGGAGDAVVNWIVNDSLTYVMGVDDDDSDKFKISTSAGLGLGDSVTINTDGDITTVNRFYPEGGLFPRRLSQNTIPASGTGADQIDAGECLLWHDADGANTHVVFNDPINGVVSVALT